MLNREYSKRLYFRQVVKNNKINRNKLWKIINNIVTINATSHCKTNGVLDVHGKFVDKSKKFGTLMNNNFVSIADGCCHKYDEFCFDSV